VRQEAQARAFEALDRQSSEIVARLDDRQAFDRQQLQFR
jgi:hypothetical protein